MVSNSPPNSLYFISRFSISSRLIVSIYNSFLHTCISHKMASTYESMKSSEYQGDDMIPDDLGQFVEEVDFDQIERILVRRF